MERHLSLIDSDPTNLPGELAGCLVNNPRHPSRRRYIAYEGGPPVAFVAIDLPPIFSLYYLYVMRERRSAGIGTWLIQEIEKVAVALGQTVIPVRPRVIDDDVDLETLAPWYRRRGFAPTADPDLWERPVA
jgi:GNAT superfamily N-acetyltransferase